MAYLFIFQNGSKSIFEEVTDKDLENCEVGACEIIDMETESVYDPDKDWENIGGVHLSGHNGEWKKIPRPERGE